MSVASRGSLGRIGRALGAALVVLALAPPLAQATFPGRNGLLAVTYGFDCPGGQVATLEPDGRRLHRLMPLQCRLQGRRVGRASWSPDGRQLIFEYELPRGVASNLECCRIATMRAEGSERRDVPLPRAPALSVPGLGDLAAFSRSDPTFSSDGLHVLYTRVQSEPPEAAGDGWSYSTEIWSAALDGSDEHRVGAGVGGRVSPDGRRIASVRWARWGPAGQEESGALLLSSARTGRLIRHLWRGTVGSVDWSPDGRRILFTGARGDNVTVPWDLYAVRPDGTGLKRLTSTRRVSETEAVWSPDGRRLAVVREVRGPLTDGESIVQTLWTMRPDGTAQRRIRGPWRGTDEDGRGRVQISWQPRRSR